MDVLGRVHSQRERAHMVGHRAGVGKVLVVREATMQRLPLAVHETG
jgi:hypothetical protein